MKFCIFQFKSIDYYCIKCCANFENLEDANAHSCGEISSDISENVIATYYSCDKCPRLFTNSRALKGHERVHKSFTTTTSFKCELCNTLFHSKRSLDLHSKMHEIRPLRSLEDALTYKTKQFSLQTEQFHCEICDKKFDNHLLKIHQNMHLNNINEDTTTQHCKYCNRAFTCNKSYEMHLQVHEQSKAKQKLSISRKGEYVCQYCGHCFKRPHEKVIHERIHTGEKPYACEVCGKCFRIAYSLTMHLRTHTTVRPFECNICNKCYKTSSSLSHHLRTHKNERAFKCDMCTKSFQTAVQFNAHKNSHLKPFSCTQCNRTFSALSYLREHMNSHNEMDTDTKRHVKYSCDICGAIYIRIDALRKHIKVNHSSNEISNLVENDVADNVYILQEDNVSNDETVQNNYILLESNDILPDVTEDNEEAILIAAANAAELNNTEYMHYTC